MGSYFVIGYSTRWAIFLFCMFVGRGMPLKSILHAMRFILVECGLVAMHGGLVHAYFAGLWLFGSVKFDVAKDVMSHTLDTAYFFLQITSPYA